MSMDISMGVFVPVDHTDMLLDGLRSTGKLREPNEWGEQHYTMRKDPDREGYWSRRKTWQAEVVVTRGSHFGEVRITPATADDANEFFTESAPLRHQLIEALAPVRPIGGYFEGYGERSSLDATLRDIGPEIDWGPERDGAEAIDRIAAQFEMSPDKTP